MFCEEHGAGVRLTSNMSNDRKLKVEMRAIAALAPYAKNARTHSKSQIRQVADSIRAFGWTNPVLIDDEGGIIAGHARVEAAKLLGQAEVPTIRLSQMTEAQKRAYIIADNKLAENAGWDIDLLGLEFEALGGLELDFDLSITGFEVPEIDLLIEGAQSFEASDPTDIPPEPSPGPAVTQLGDIWNIGPHRLICGDATLAKTFSLLMDGEKAQMVFTDPPYNVPVDGHVSGKGKHKHREFTMASGEMPEAAFREFLKRAFRNLQRSSADGAIQFVCMDWRHMAEVLAAARAIYELKNLCVWTKTNGGMGSLYRSQHELVFVFKSGAAQHINNVQLGRFGRNRTNIWEYAGANAFGRTRDDDLAVHPTVKPVRLIANAILDCSHRSGIVLDAFAGSGSTLIAADQTGRIGYGVELDPAYCDVVIKRLAAQGGHGVFLQQSGDAFEDVAETRIGAAS